MRGWPRSPPVMLDRRGLGTPPVSTPRHLPISKDGARAVPTFSARSHNAPVGRRARSPPRRRRSIRLGHAWLPARRTLDDGLFLGQRSGPGGSELQLEADELSQAHPRAAWTLEPIAEEARTRVTDDVPRQEPVHLGMRGLTGGHDLEQPALVGDASDLVPVAEHGRIVVGKEAPDLEDLPESGGVTTNAVERAICAHGDPPVDGADLLAVNVRQRGLSGGGAGTMAPLAIEMVAEGAERLCPDSE